MRLGLFGKKASRLQNASSAFADIEDSIRFLVEVRYLALCARKRNGIGRDHHAAILDIEADRAPPVHRKPQRLAFGFEVRSKGVKRTICVAVVSAPKVAHAILC